MFLSDSDDEQRRKPAAQHPRPITKSDDDMFLSDSDGEQRRKPAAQHPHPIANSYDDMFLSDDDTPLPPPGAPIVGQFSFLRLF